MPRPFRPGANEDRYRTALASLIEDKTYGVGPTIAPAEGPPPTEDLADALARSVEAAMRDDGAAGRGEQSPTARRAS